MPDDVASDLPNWPAAAREVPHAEKTPGPSLDGWLYVAGIAYPLAVFGVMVVGFRMGHFWDWWAIVFVPALLAKGLVVALKLDGANLRWLSVIAFVTWVFVVEYLQFRFLGMVYANC